MINPNSFKRVKATVIDDGARCVVNGQTHDIYYRRGDKIKQNGSRYLFVNYSIMSETYLFWGAPS